jgi:hypothetical protein
LVNLYVRKWLKPITPYRVDARLIDVGGGAPWKSIIAG